MSTNYKKGLGIQREYADKRRRALNKRDEEKIEQVEATIVRLARRNNVQLTDAQKPGWQTVYDRIITRLQNANLTINMDAENWFGNENRYKTYATTYQKNLAKQDGKTVLKTQYKSTGEVSEGADSRLHADDRTTLPEDWGSASRLHPQRRRLYKAMSANKGKDINSLTRVDLGNGKEGFAIENRHFNANAKQVFAALNYARRPHGSSVYYGYSHIVLRPELKRKAIYFPGDTYMVAMARNSTQRQCTFETLGAVLAYCMDSMSNAIWQSCYDNLRCEDTEDAFELLEAHVFDEVRIDKDVQELWLSRRKKDGEIEGEQWAEVRRNAAEWATRNHVRLIFMSST